MSWRAKILVLAVLGLMVAQQALAQKSENPQLEQIKALENQAKKLGAKGQLPMAWRQLESHRRYAEENGATPEQWEKIRQEALLLVNKADLLRQMRKRKNSCEALLGRFDQALAEIASLQGVELDPVKSGTNQATELLERLNDRNLARQVVIDSLTVANRSLNEQVGGRLAAQDSLITSLTVEVRALRQKLWETELRAGVAEADRSAAESVLTRKQAREAALDSLHAAFSAQEGEILLKGDRRIIMRMVGISFGVGSSQLKAGQDALLAKVARAVQFFPGAKVSIEGHTDDTGGREANLRLSRRRAETVARTLEKMLGQPKKSIATAGFGPDRPVALNDTPEGRARNRRIDVILDLPE